MQINEIREQIQRKTRLTAKLSTLYDQQKDLQVSEERLRAARAKEQEDVERMEGGSLAGFFYRVAGRGPERLDKERREAYEAAVKHDTVVGELAGIEDEIIRTEAELCSLAGAEDRLELAIREKKEWLKANLPQKAQRILVMEESIAALLEGKREIDEAQKAGNMAYQTAKETRNSLDSAAGWGTWDILGGGLVSTMAKHSHLDKAQDKVNLLQQQLRAFRTELVDVSFYEDIEIQIDGFLRFADYFWDGIFTDMMVQGKIRDAQDQVQQVLTKVESIILQLQGMSRETEQRLEAENAELVRLVENHS